MRSNVVLTGFMGVGKTTVGKMLAKKLGYQFVDTDDLIVRTYQMPIVEIFNKYGEGHFRETEKAVVRKTAEKYCQVIATGGGVVKDKENMSLLREKGVVVYLSASVDKILKNVGENTSRPLLNDKTPEQIAQMMAGREKFYQDCDIKIHTDHLTALQITNKILRCLERIK